MLECVWGSCITLKLSLVDVEYLEQEETMNTFLLCHLYLRNVLMLQNVFLLYAEIV
jgi:hypothetical protein